MMVSLPFKALMARTVICSYSPGPIPTTYNLFKFHTPFFHGKSDGHTVSANFFLYDFTASTGLYRASLADIVHTGDRLYEIRRGKISFCFQQFFCRVHRQGDPHLLTEFPQSWFLLFQIDSRRLRYRFMEQAVDLAGFFKQFFDLLCRYV